MQWSFQKQLVGFCEMDSLEDSKVDNCCSLDNTESNMQMMCCSTTSSRLVSNSIDLQIQHSSEIDTPKSKLAVIKNKWFNSNYLHDTSLVYQGLTQLPTPNKDAFKFKNIDRASYLCIYRI